MIIDKSTTGIGCPDFLGVNGPATGSLVFCVNGPPTSFLAFCVDGPATAPFPGISGRGVDLRRFCCLSSVEKSACLEREQGGLTMRVILAMRIEVVIEGQLA